MTKQKVPHDVSDRNGAPVVVRSPASGGGLQRGTERRASRGAGYRGGKHGV